MIFIDYFWSDEFLWPMNGLNEAYSSYVFLVYAQTFVYFWHDDNTIFKCSWAIQDTYKYSIEKENIL